MDTIIHTEVKWRRLLIVLFAILIGTTGCKKPFNPNSPDNKNISIPVEFTPIGQCTLHSNFMLKHAKKGLIIAQQSEWDILREEIKGAICTTDNFLTEKVNFSTCQIIAVFEEIKSNDGWSIDITEVTEYDDEIIVKVTNFNMGNDKEAETQPFHIITIPISEKEIVFEYNIDDPNMPCFCIMDTLRGEWSWTKTYGGFDGITTDNEFISIIKILNQNEDASINYETIVADTLFYKGSFRMINNQWTWWVYEVVDIKLPHWIPDGGDGNWGMCFGNIGSSSEDTIMFWDGTEDGYYYFYQKIKKE
ncbi:MAG: hypothetical protein LBH92_01205 [Bacteroidales bacterium]|jgi:hypothetical protein|nr:hypothetical protein [Bacteroidales bacterium]